MKQIDEFFVSLTAETAEPHDEITCASGSFAKVVAVTGSMGSGKSTVVKRLESLLPRAVAVHEDDHQSMTQWTADDVRRWQDAGGDVAKLPLEGLPDRLAMLRDPACGHCGIVLLESQFGRHHPALAPLVDFQIWLDVPADVALARRVAQLAGERVDDSSARLAWIARMSAAYAAWTATLVHRQRESVAAAADVIVDAGGAVTDVVDRCIAAIARFRGAA